MTTKLTWVFDLDNTLHNASPHIFPHINRSMTAYLQRHLQLTEEDAGKLRAHYWRSYGATLLGMMRHHGTDPEHFLRETHAFPDLSTWWCTSADSQPCCAGCQDANWCCPTHRASTPAPYCG